MGYFLSYPPFYPLNAWMSMNLADTHWTTKNPQTFSGSGFLHFFGLLYYIKWCRRPDSNRHGSPHTPLKRARLPIPPLRQTCYSLFRLFFCTGFFSSFVLSWSIHNRVFLGHGFYLLNLSRLTDSDVTHHRSAAGPG